ncbi:MAG: D-tyrosyl-tRNA(Tyr) deacylase [Silicimonas sp.]|nr:D-tyrosyl-tRNA(Tyr) deacylase [Silicimonas sp.]
MRALIQRVSEASVTVDGELIGEIGPGIVIFACAMAGDPEDAATKMATKISKLRIFPDEQGRMNRSVLDTGGSALVVSQFTLAADTSRGNRPGFSTAAPPDEGEARVTAFGDALQGLGVPVARGRFGADMKVALLNDGPVTIWIDSGG